MRAFLFFIGLCVLGLLIYFLIPLSSTVTFSFSASEGLEVPFLFFVVFLLLLMFVLFYPFYVIRSRRSSKHMFLKELIRSLHPKAYSTKKVFEDLLRFRSVRSFAYLNLFRIAKNENNLKEAMVFLDRLKDYPFYKDEKTALYLALSEPEKAYRTDPKSLSAILAYYPVSTSPWKILLDAYLEDQNPLIADSLRQVFSSFSPRVQKKVVQKISDKYPKDPLVFDLSKNMSKKKGEFLEDSSFMD